MKKAIPHLSRIISIVLSLVIAFACFAVMPLTVSASDATHTPIAPTLDEIVFPVADWVTSNRVQKTEVTGGVKVEFIDGENIFLNGLRAYYDRALNLDGLYLDFANYVCTNESDTRKGFSVYFGEGANMLTLHFAFDFVGITNALWYKVGNGSDYGQALCSDVTGLSYADIKGKAFGLYLDIADNGDLNVTVYVEGTTVCSESIPAADVAASGINTASSKMYIGDSILSAAAFSVDFLGYARNAEPDHTVTAPALSEVVDPGYWPGIIERTQTAEGVKVNFTANGGLYNGGYRVYFNKDLNLDGLYLDFANYTSTLDHNEYSGFSICFGEGANSLTIQFVFSISGYVNEIRYRAGNDGANLGTVLYKDTAISYNNFKNKNFYLYFDIDAAGNLNVNVNLYNGETVLSGASIPASAVAASGINTAATKVYIGNNIGQVSSYSINFLGYAQVETGEDDSDETEDGSNFGYKINPVIASDFINVWWSNTLAVTDLDGGGVNVDFTGGGNDGMKTDGYRLLYNKYLSLDGLYFELGNYNPINNWPTAFGISFDDGDSNAGNAGNLWLQFNCHYNNQGGTLRYTNIDGSTSDTLYTVDELWILNIRENKNKMYVYTELDDEGNLCVNLGFDTGKVYTGAKIPASVLEDFGVNTASTRLRICAASTTSTWTYSIDFYGYYQGMEKIPTAQDVCTAIDALGTITAESDREVKKIFEMYSELSDAQKALVPDEYIAKYLAAENELAAAIKSADASLVKFSADAMHFTTDADGNITNWANYLTLTDLSAGGVNIAFNNSPDAVIEYPEQKFDLNGLTLQFDNLTLKDKSKPFKFTLFNNEDYGEYQGQGTEGLIFSIDTNAGTLSVGNAEYTSDLLKYANLNGRRFSIGFSEFGTDEDLEINFVLTLKVGAQTEKWDVSYNDTAGFKYFDEEKSGNCHIVFKPSSNGGTYSFDLVGYKYSGYSGGINNSDLIPEYIPVTETEVDANGTPTWADDLIIAEVNPLKLGGDIAALYPVLEHLEETGINALWLCPIYDTENSSATDVTYSNLGIHTINPALTGTENYEEGWKIFADFVEEAHKHNIRIFLDVVTWGCADKSALETVPGYNDNWVYAYEDDFMYNWKNNGLVNWFVNQMVTLAETTNVDGFRYDCGYEYCGIGLLEKIRTALQNKGRNLFMISENAGERSSNGKTVYDTEQTSLIINGKEGRDYLDYIRTNPYINGDLSLIDTVKKGTNLNAAGAYKYYTTCLSNHDVSGTVFKSSELAIGYQTLFSPTIPMWYLGEEIGWELKVEGILYYQDLSSWKSILSANSEFYENVKQMIRIRRSYKQIFGNFADKITDSNICKIEQTNADITLESYARYADGKAIIVVGNENADAKTATLSVASALSNMGLNNKYIGYVVTNAMTGEVLYDNAHGEDLTALSIDVNADDVAVIAIEEKVYDLNGDGLFNSLDLTVLRQSLISGETENLAMDINGSKAVDIADLVRAKKILSYKV